MKLSKVLNEDPMEIAKDILKDIKENDFQILEAIDNISKIDLSDMRTFIK